MYKQKRTSLRSSLAFLVFVGYAMMVDSFAVAIERNTDQCFKESEFPQICFESLLTQKPVLPTALVTNRGTKNLDSHNLQLVTEATRLLQEEKSEAALEKLQKALTQVRATDNWQEEFIVLVSLGSVYSKIGRSQDASRLLQDALSLVEQKTGKRVTLGDLFQAFGDLMLESKKYAQAIDAYQISLTVKQETGDYTGEKFIFRNIASSYETLGQFTKALEFHQKALIAMRKVGDRKGEAASLGSIGNTYLYIGENFKALEAFQSSLAITVEIGDLENEGINLHNIGVIYFFTSNYSKALEAYQKALIVRRKLKDKHQEAANLGNIGDVYDALGNRDKAIDFYQQALKLEHQVNQHGVEQPTPVQFAMYRVLGEYSKALEAYERLLIIHRERGERNYEGITLYRMANIYVDMNDYKKALEFYQKARLIARETNADSGEGIILGSIGDVYYKLGNYSKALEFYKQVLPIHSTTGERDKEGAILSSLGASYIGSEQYSQAEQALYESIGILESLRPGLKDTDKVSLIDFQSNAYQFLQHTLTIQHKYTQALEVSERARTRAFVELLSRRLTNTPTESPKPLNFADIQRIPQQQYATIVQYSSFIDEKLKKAELYIWVISPTGKLDFRKVDLPQNSSTNFLEKVQEAIAVAQSGFRDGKTRSFSHNTLQPGMRVSLKDDQPTWDPWTILNVDSQKQEIRVKNLNAEKTIPVTMIARIDQSSLQTLYQMLIQPISDLLPADPNQRIIFIPQGALFNLPFAALMDEQGKYLIQKHTLLTAPSIQTLDLTRQQRQRLKTSVNQGTIVVGNPTMPKVSLVPGNPATQLSKLPFAETEAKEIARLLNTTAITGKDATKTSLLAKLPNARIIHLATHGLLDDYKGDAIPGAIALAPSGSDDGLLRSRDILDLKLNAELVVLSACDTGKGKITGDGVLGLSRSLFVAGTPSVIVSLWQVNDNSTAELMTAFYLHWQKTGDKAVALRQAMLDTMQKYPDPKDWAAFTLIGEAEE